MPDRSDAFRRLPSPVRARLEAFVEALDSLSTEQITILGTRPADTETHERARAAADERIQWNGWQDALLAIRQEILQWMIRRYATISPGLEWATPTVINDNLRIVDHLRIGQSLADALRAIAVWDEIDEGYRDELLGPWAALVEEVDA